MTDLEHEVKVLRQMVVTLLSAQVDGEGWQRIDAFCTWSGWSEDQVREYRKNGTWPDGIITKVQGRRIHVNLPAYNYWVKTGRVPPLAA